MEVKDQRNFGEYKKPSDLYVINIIVWVLGLGAVFRKMYRKRIGTVELILASTWNAVGKFVLLTKSTILWRNPAPSFFVRMSSTNNASAVNNENNDEPTTVSLPKRRPGSKLKRRRGKPCLVSVKCIVAAKDPFCDINLLRLIFTPQRKLGCPCELCASERICIDYRTMAKSYQKRARDVAAYCRHTKARVPCCVRKWEAVSGTNATGRPKGTLLQS